MKLPRRKFLHLAAGGAATLPAVAEFVPGYEAGGFVGIGAPRNTPAAIVEKLNKEINGRKARVTRADIP